MSFKQTVSVFLGKESKSDCGQNGNQETSPHDENEDDLVVCQY